MSEIQNIYERQYPNQNSSSSFERDPSPSGHRKLPDDLEFNVRRMHEDADGILQGNDKYRIKQDDQYLSASLFQNLDVPIHHQKSANTYQHQYQPKIQDNLEGKGVERKNRAFNIDPTRSPTSKNLDKHLANSSPSLSEAADSDNDLGHHYIPPKHHHKYSDSQRRKKSSSSTRRKDISLNKGKSAPTANPVSSTSSEIKDIKSSLKEHFKAIKSLQTALSIGNPPLETASSSNLEKAARPLEQTSQDIRERIKMIEATLREVGEPVSVSETNSDQKRRHLADLNMNSPSFHSLLSLKPPTAPVVSNAPLIEVDRLNSRLDKMEKVMEDISNSLNERVNLQAKTAAAVAPPNNIETSEQITKLTSEIHKLRFDFKNYEKQNAELMAKNLSLEKKVETLQSQKPRASAPKDNEDEEIDPKLQNYCKRIFQKYMSQIESTLNDKVDTAVLEELAHHIATKDELKKFVKKTTLNKFAIENAMKTGKHDAKAEAPHHNDDAMEKMKAKLSKVSADLKKIEARMPSIFATSPEKQSELFIQGQLFELESKMHKKLQDWVLEQMNSQMEVIEASNDKKIGIAKESVQTTVKALISDNIRKALEESPADFLNIDAESHPLIRKMVRDFDEKLYTVCSDLSACKQLFVNQSNQPFYRCAQWMWTSGSLKLGSAVPWNLQTSNTDPDNFKWDQDHFNIRIADAGLYEINLAFFTKAKPSIQLVVNGESVLSAINSPSYVIQHSSGYVMDGNGKMEPGTVTGISLVDFLALPSKSTLSIHYHGVKKNTPAHGFLGLKRL